MDADNRLHSNWTCGLKSAGARNFIVHVRTLHAQKFTKTASCIGDRINANNGVQDKCTRRR